LNLKSIYSCQQIEESRGNIAGLLTSAKNARCWNQSGAHGQGLLCRAPKHLQIEKAGGKSRLLMQSWCAPVIFDQSRLPPVF
jgi:hypothetical protein